MAEASAERATKEVFDLFRKYGNRDYIGEPVSQQEHMTQCAMLAEKDGYSNEVILGVFLHDVGHLVGFDKDLPPMGDVGTYAHEIIGEQFLRDLGFPESVTSFVRGHVDAKRYLVFKYPDYHEKVWLYMIPGGGGYSKTNWVGVCGPLPKTLTLFMTKICDFPYPIYDLK